ncbi:MAG: hypothetical protein PVF49_07530 [Anaerolineales bacterium]
MSKRPILIFLLPATLLLSACGFPGLATPTSDVNLAVTQTLEAINTLAASAFPQATDTPEAPTSTPTITPTATSSIPMVSVSQNTNCRFGPGTVYDLLGALLIGETTEVTARSSVPNYWVVSNPDRPGECWLWGQYASVTGDTSSLAVRTPPPTPTPLSPGTISGYAYIDGDNNNQRGDPADGTLSGARIHLLEGACPGGTELDMVESQSGTGYYEFINVDPGDYCVTRDFTQQTLDPDWYDVTVGSGETVTEINFRYVP